VEDCDFLDSENAIEINGRNNQIRNCVFLRIGANSNSPAIQATFVDSINNDGSPAQRNRVERCTFSLIGLTAIQLHRGMDTFFNDVSGTHRRGNDVGAISAFPNTDLLGIEVGYNWVHDSFPIPKDTTNGKVFYGSHGIYTDRGVRNATFYRNVVWGMTGPAIAMLRTGNGTGNSGRIVDHNTAIGEISFESNTDTITFRNNLQNNTLFPTTNVVLTTNLRVSNKGAGWVDAANNTYTLRPDSMAIDTGTILGNAAYQQYTGSAPDAGAYEFGIAWEFEPGATLINGTLPSPSSITISPSADRQTATATLTVFQTPRKLPPNSQARLGSNAPSSALRQTVLGSNGSLVITFENLPLGNLTGSQPFQISLNGGSSWHTLANVSIPPPNTVNLSLPAQNPLANSTITIPRSSLPFASPIRYQRTVTVSNPSGQRLDFYP
ncbi:MAG: hypothetical protein NZL93_05840, partial [Chthoniobacterales bacterium]|nr:hypothetical protein [Chthoniobacterales bacterium]